MMSNLKLTKVYLPENKGHFYGMDISDFMKFQNAVCAVKIYATRSLNERQVQQLSKGELELLKAGRILGEIERNMVKKARV